MNSQGVDKLAVFDPNIVQQRPAFAVYKGAQSNTNAPFRAIASSASQQTYNVQVPSQNVFIDRELNWSSDVFFSVDVAFDTAVANGAGDTYNGSTELVLRFGKDVALCAFPLHSLVSTMTATINDTVATMNTSDVLYEIARLVNSKKNRLQRTAPTMLDKYADYDDAVGAVNNPLASFIDGTDYDNLPNGAFWDIVETDSAGVPKSPTTMGGVTDGSTSVTLHFRARLTEKLLLSPFIFHEECGDEVGLFGVNNIQLVMNMKSPTRLLRNAPGADSNGRTVSNVRYNTTKGAFENSQVNVIFKTPSLDIDLPPKSVVPYLEYPRFITTGLGSISADSESQIQSQTITLPQIPDMLLVYVKPQTYSGTQGDWYLPITKLSVNFDNYAGLLSSHSTSQLYNISVDNGLEMDWNSWNGYAVGKEGERIQGVGGFLVLRMGKDITLQAGQAPSVVGNYTLQMSLTVRNPSDSSVTPTLYVVAVNSGFFETQMGSSRIVKGVLNEQDVIGAEIAPMSTASQLQRMVGGSFFSKLGTALNKAREFLSRKEVRDAIKGVARSTGIPALKKGADIAESYGFGMSGGAMTGGKRTGGRSKAKLSALM